MDRRIINVVNKQFDKFKYYFPIYMIFTSGNHCETFKFLEDLINSKDYSNIKLAYKIMKYYKYEKSTNN